MKEKNKRAYGKKGSFYPDIFDTDNVVSSTECTGLSPKSVQDEYEKESYTDIYDIHLESNKVYGSVGNKSRVGSKEKSAPKE